MDQTIGSGPMLPLHGISFIIVAIAVFLFILAVLWFFLPFAVFGTKARLDDIKAQLENTNKKLQLIIDSGNNVKSSAPPLEKKLASKP